MKEMTINEAVKLVNAKEATSISLYLKTDYTGRDSATKAKGNMMRLYKTVEEIIGRSVDVVSKNRLLAPLKRTLDNLRITQSKGGIAIYHNEDFTGIVRITTNVSDLVVAAQSFHLKPILRSLQYHRNYYLLALRSRCADLFLVTPDGHTKLDRVEWNAPVGSQLAETAKGAQGKLLKVRRGKNLNKNAGENFGPLNQALKGHFEQKQFPLMISGPSHLHEAFRGSSEYSYIMQQGLEGDTEYLDEKALLGLSGQVFEQFLLENDKHAAANFLEASNVGAASTNIAEIAVAAARGQVKSLLIAEDTHVWGLLDRTNGAIEILSEKEDATSDDLLDDLAELTLQKGGNVTVLPSAQMPHGVSIAAILRWSDSGNCDHAFVPLRSRNHFSSVSNGR
jgi:Bacterial archaeo-eukaryotic release factor family 3